MIEEEEFWEIFFSMKRKDGDALLLEDGDFLLFEDGDKIRLEDG